MTAPATITAAPAPRWTLDELAALDMADVLAAPRDRALTRSLRDARDDARLLAVFEVQFRGLRGAFLDEVDRAALAPAATDWDEYDDLLSRYDPPAEPLGAAGGVIPTSHVADPPAAAGTAVPASSPAAPTGVLGALAGAGPSGEVI